MRTFCIALAAAALAGLWALPALAGQTEEFAQCYQALAHQDYQRCVIYCTPIAEDENLDARVRSAAMSNRGICQEFSGNLRRAMEDQDDAVQLWPENASAYANRAFLYVKTGELGLAKADTNRALELDPTCRVPEF